MYNFLSDAGTNSANVAYNVSKNVYPKVYFHFRSLLFPSIFVADDIYKKFEHLQLVLRPVSWAKHLSLSSHRIHDIVVYPTFRPVILETHKRLLFWSKGNHSLLHQTWYEFPLADLRPSSFWELVSENFPSNARNTRDKVALEQRIYRNVAISAKAAILTASSGVVDRREGCLQSQCSLCDPVPLTYRIMTFRT